MSTSPHNAKFGKFIADVISDSTLREQVRMGSPVEVQSILVARGFSQDEILAIDKELDQLIEPTIEGNPWPRRRRIRFWL